MNLGSPNSIPSVEWMQGSLVADTQQPLTWYKVGQQRGCNLNPKLCAHAS